MYVHTYVCTYVRMRGTCMQVKHGHTLHTVCCMCTHLHTYVCSLSTACMYVCAAVLVHCRWMVWRMRSHSQSPTEWMDVPSSLSTLVQKAPLDYGGSPCPVLSSSIVLAESAYFCTSLRTYICTHHTLYVLVLICTVCTVQQYAKVSIRM